MRSTTLVLRSNSSLSGSRSTQSVPALVEAASISSSMVDRSRRRLSASTTLGKCNTAFESSQTSTTMLSTWARRAATSTGTWEEPESSNGKGGMERR